MTDPITRAREALARHESQNVTDPFHFPLTNHLYGALRDLLAMVEAEPVQGDVSIDENFLAVAEGLGLLPKKRQEALEELARIEAKFERQAEPSVEYVRKGVCLLCGGAVLNSGEHLEVERHEAEVRRITEPSDTDERETIPDLMGNLRKSLEAKIARKAEREALHDAGKLMNAHEPRWGGVGACTCGAKLGDQIDWNWHLANEAIKFGVAHRQGQITDADDRGEAEALYPLDGGDPNIIIALRSAYRAGVAREGRAALEAAEEARRG